MLCVKRHWTRNGQCSIRCGAFAVAAAIARLAPASSVAYTGVEPPVTRLTSHLRGYLPGIAPATTNALPDISGIISVIQSVNPDAMRMSDSTYTKTIRAMQFVMFHCLLNAGLFAGHKWLIAQLVAG